MPPNFQTNRCGPSRPSCVCVPIIPPKPSSNMRRILALVLAAATVQASLAFLLPAAPAARSMARTQGVVR